MKTWTVSKDVLLEAVDVMSLVPSQPGVPSSEFFRIIRKGKACKFCLSSIVSGEISVVGKGRFPFKIFYLDRKVFLPFVGVAKELRGDLPFVFTAKGKHLLVMHGKRRAVFNASTKVMGYTFQPNEKLQSKVVLDQKARKLITCARDCSPNDTVSPVLNCVYIRPYNKGLGVYATNTLVMFKGRASAKISPRIPLPLGLVPLLGSEQLKSVHWRKRLVALHFSCGNVWQPVSAKALKRFPVSAIEKVMQRAQAYPLLFKVKSQRFGKVIARLGMYLGAVRRQDWVLELVGIAGKRSVKLVSNVPGSSFKEVVVASAPMKKDFALTWPLSNLLPVFEYLASSRQPIAVRSKGGISYVSTPTVQVSIARKKEK
jgi:hypothetical protein